MLPGLIGERVVVAGWVQHRRDHGGVVFVDLRDRSGIVQVVFKPDTSPEAHTRAGELRPEFVLLAEGRVDRRSEETINPTVATGKIEVDPSALGQTEVAPFAENRAAQLPGVSSQMVVGTISHGGMAFTR